MRFGKGMGACALWVILLWLSAAAQEHSFHVEGRIRIAGRAPGAGSFMIRLAYRGGAVREIVSFDGSFVFENVPAGSYVLEVSAPGQAVDSRPLIVLGNEYLDIELGSGADHSGAHGPVAVLELQIPSSAQRNFEKAARMIRESNCENAVTRLERAIQLFPQYSLALNALGNCWVRMNRPEAAEEAFKRALAVNPSLYPTLNLANLYRSQGKLQEAEALLTNGIRQYPEEGNAYFALARLRFAQNRLAEAEALGGQAHLHRDHSADVHLLLAKIHQAGKSFDQMNGDLQLYSAEAGPGPMRDLANRILRQAAVRK
jgi:tetratricopeptide (TPR) repeat protein